MALDLSWVRPEHAAKAAELVPVIVDACERAEKSTRFINMQLNPKAEWRGWPTELAEQWLAKRPSILLRYFDDEATTSQIAEALRVMFNGEYRPRTGNSRGMPAREGVPGLDVPEAITKALDTVTWQVIRKFGGVPDQAGFVQAAKVASKEDSDDERAAQITSVGTVQGKARKARYTSIRGDLYWSDIRNSLELFIRARPELIDSFNEWEAKNRPRAWEDGGSWYAKGPGDRREANPLLRIKAGAYKRASQMVTEWKREGHLSYDGLEPDTDFDILDDGMGGKAVGEVAKVRPERRQQKEQYYAWGLRDRTDCYDFPVTVTTS